METMLDHGRRRVISANITTELRASFNLITRGVIAIAILFLILRVLAWSFGTPSPSGLQIITITTLFVISVCLFAIYKGYKGAATKTHQVAERLDIAQETHNKVATAIELLKSGDESPFAQAAISDGWKTLKDIQQEEPLSNDPELPWTTIARNLLIAIALFITAISLTPKNILPDPNQPNPTPINNIVTTPLDPKLIKNQTDKPSEAESSETPNTGAKPSPIKISPEAKPSPPQTPNKNNPSKSKGKSGNHSPSESRSSKSTSKSSSSGSGGGSKSKPSDKKQKPAKPKKPKKQKPSKDKKDDKKSKNGGSISARGASGASSKSSAQNEWSSKIKAKAEDSEDAPQDEDHDDDAKSENLRSGVQPSLKNRSAKVSRDLSLSKGKGKKQKKSRGRGGPGGGKKSRGTASMIMGVPVPGFVKGRLLPGSTKSTQEEIKPTPKPSKYFTASNLKSASPKENTQEHFRPSTSTAFQAKQYLIKYHAENENKTKDDKASK